MIGALIFAVFTALPTAYAAKAKLRLRVVNRLDEPKTMTLRSNLPSRITTNDIVSLGGMSLRYDVKSDVYYVYEEIELAPKAHDTRVIEINDIWLIDEEKINSIENKANELIDMLAGTDYSAKGAAVLEQIKAKTEAVLKSQDENAISKVSVVRHIQAYETNLKDLQQASQGLGQLENYALSAGLSPGDGLSGEDKSAARPNRDVHFPEEYGTAIYRVSVVNDSPVARKTDLRQDLPSEVTIDDVLDSAGFSVARDEETGLIYLHRKGVEVEANNRVEFRVTIRDKWNINGPRIKYLHKTAEELRITTSGRKKIEAVENTIKRAIADLETIAEEKGPVAFGPAYIAFYRRQADRLDTVESSLNRIEAAIRPLETKKGFDIPAPDKKTTWIIIYSILGFLAVVSMLFFLRWYVRSAAEKE